ncbi:hypothetical protein BDZ89DRAFT_1157052 [Hymenopellis radicata]|nr:hypothetical protein BDZ89DRAFT_1157052 [Hymenopellis radicata]
MPTKSENDLKAEWLQANVSYLCDSCKIDGMGCRKQPNAIACVQCKSKKRDCSRMVEWRKWKEEHIHSTSTSKTSSVKRTTIRVPRIQQSTLHCSHSSGPKIWRQPLPPNLRLFSVVGPTISSLVYQETNMAPTPPSTSPSSATQLLLDTTQEEKPDIASRPKPTPIIPLQLLPIPQPPPQHPSFGAPPQDVVRRLENQIRTLKRDLLEKENAVDTLSAAKNDSISSSEIYAKHAWTNSCISARTASNFRDKLQEFQQILEELGARHLDQFPTDFDDGVDLLDNYRSDSGRRGRSDGDLLDSREAKKLRTDPWDSLISTPASSSPSPLSRPVSTSPVLTSIPKLVPESDEGNVEYKLQLLSPSATRFARLVTQLKWRLLEGGGQAYYELGVADSGALVGLPRSELEQTLETLEMMAGEIGASVIVVKEIEVPAALTTLAILEDYNGSHRRREAFRVSSDDSFFDGGHTTGTETETDADNDNSESDAGLRDASSSSLAIFSMDLESEASESEPAHTFSIDLEISSVFKPRPVRRRVNPLGTLPPNENKKLKKKFKHMSRENADGEVITKGQKRRQARDRRREDRRKALEVHATEALPPTKDVATDELVSGLEELHVSVEPQPFATTDDAIPAISLTEVDGDDDVFATPAPASHSFAKKVQVPGTGDGGEPRLIVEALVVRKMSLEEAFLDFGGFALE